jgi:hypothetical protein
VAGRVAGDARVAGGIDLASLEVGGTLTVPEGEPINGTVTANQTVRAPVTVEPACACDPGDLVDIGDFVVAHRDANENLAIGLDADALTDYGGDTVVELPCGRYYLGPIRGDGALTLRVSGRVALMVDGDVTMTAPLAIELVGDDAELDLMIAGLLRSLAPITAGDPAHPARTRIYVGGDGVMEINGDSQLATNLYAPKAQISLTGTATVFGSLFVRRLEQAAPVVIHYDLDVLRADSACPD